MHCGWGAGDSSCFWLVVSISCLSKPVYSVTAKLLIISTVNSYVAIVRKLMQVTVFNFSLPQYKKLSYLDSQLVNQKPWLLFWYPAIFSHWPGMVTWPNLGAVNTKSYLLARFGSISDSFGLAYRAHRFLTRCLPSKVSRSVVLYHFMFIFYYYRFVNALVYYGVFLSVPSIGGNMYLNFFLASIVELPAIPGGIWIFNRYSIT